LFVELAKAIPVPPMVRRTANDILIKRPTSALSLCLLFDPLYKDQPHTSDEFDARKRSPRLTQWSPRVGVPTSSVNEAATERSLDKGWNQQSMLEIEH
jgi:hypothetical protein